MTETIKESSLNKLLKSRYPLTHYLSRQQEFVQVLLTTTTPSACETGVIRRRKTPYPSNHSKCDGITPQAAEFYDAQTGIISDQDYNTAHDRSSETDDDSTQEYDARPLSKSNHETGRVFPKVCVYLDIILKSALKQQ